jgi:CheY-like chemotaxis protein
MTGHPSARILLIDDEPGYVNPLARLLCRDGYTVETAGDGQQALVKLQAAPYDLLLCDLRMPELDGPALYALLTQQSPYRCPRVIFLTGDMLRPASRAFLAQCGQPWLPKPCSAMQIRQVVDQVLGGL